METCCQHHSLFQAPFPSLPCYRPTAPFAFCAFEPRNEDQKGCCDGQNWSSSRWILMKGNLISTAKLFNEALKLQPQIMHIQNYAFVHRRGKISKTGSRWSALKANPCLPCWFPPYQCVQLFRLPSQHSALNAQWPCRYLKPPIFTLQMPPAVFIHPSAPTGLHIPRLEQGRTRLPPGKEPVHHLLVLGRGVNLL